MSNLTNIPLGDTQNLLSYKSLLKDNPSITFNASGVSSTGTITNAITIQKECSSFRTELFQNVVTGLSAYFDFGDALEYTATRYGNYTFSFYALKGELNVNPNYNVDVILKVYINAILTHTFTKNTPIEAGSLEDLRFVQSFDLALNDIVNFEFEIQKPSVGTPNPNIELFFTGFQLNYGNVTNYQLPILLETGWQSKVDTTNTQVLTANTDNLIAFTGTNSSNGGLTLMNSVGKITPIKVGDSVNADFAFSFPSPSGTTDYLSVKLKVNGVVYRAQSFNILEPTGETNYIAVSFTLPVEAEFKTYGAEFFVNPNVAITISNRYQQVTQLHKGR